MFMVVISVLMASGKELCIFVKPRKESRGSCKKVVLSLREAVRDDHLHSFVKVL